MRALAILTLSILGGWLLAALGVILLIELEDTAVGFDAPHITARLTLTK